MIHHDGHDESEDDRLHTGNGGALALLRSTSEALAVLGALPAADAVPLRRTS